MQTTPEFRRERCTRYRFKYSECTRCQDACPHEAVNLSDGGASIDAARCRECGLCVAACQTEALVTDKLPHIQLLKQAGAKAAGFSIACIPSQAEGDAKVPCLGALDATMLAYLSARKIKLELRGAWHCETCPHGTSGQAMIAYARDGVATLRGQADSGEHWSNIVFAGPPEESAKPVAVNHARRQMFRQVFGRAMDEALKDTPAAPVPMKAVRVAAPTSTIRRELLQIVWPRKAVGEFALDDTLPSSHFEVNDACNQCELCVRVCPTGAIGLAETDEAWRLTFQFNRCVACDVCIEACQPHALERQTSVAIATGLSKEPVTLRNRPKQRCKRCDRFFMPANAAETLCQICADDDKDFGAIFG